MHDSTTIPTNTVNPLVKRSGTNILTWLEVTIITNIHIASAKCKSVRTPQANLPDTSVDCTCAFKHCKMLPGPPGANQSALRLYKSILRCFWKHLPLWRCIQDAPFMIVKFWRYWDVCAGLRDTSRVAETSVQLCRRLGAVHSQQWFIAFHNHTAFPLWYSSLLQLQDSQHHNMACIIYLSDSIHIHTVNLAADGTAV